MSTASEFLAAFPQTERDYSTGGNCTAWRIVLAGGGEILLTDGGAQQPTLGESQVVITIGDRDGGWVPVDGLDRLVPWAEAIADVGALVKGGKHAPISPGSGHCVCGRYASSVCWNAREQESAPHVAARDLRLMANNARILKTYRVELRRIADTLDGAALRAAKGEA